MNQEERQNQKRVKVDPLSGIYVDGFKFTEPRRCRVKQFYSSLSQPFFIDKDEIAHDIQNLLKTPHKFLQEFLPLSAFQQDTSREGTRTLKGVIQRHSDKIIVLSGIGVVRKLGFPSNEFIIESPYWRETVDKYLEMGHMQISQEGNVWGHRNSTVFGAYDIDDLKTKLNHTYQYSSIVNKPYDMKILLAGKHRQSSEHGWMAYALPANSVRITELQQVDLMQRKETNDPGIYGQFIALLFRRIKEMHAQGVVHLELHPGNCYPILHVDGSIDLVITDWTTAQSLLALPGDDALSKKGYVKKSTPWIGLSASETAKATDLFVALENVQLMSNGYIDTRPELKKEFGVEISSLAVSSYTELKYDLTEIGDIIKWILNEKAIPEVLKKNEMIRSDWKYAHGDIDRMDRPNYLMKSAFSILTHKVASFLASGKHEMFN